MVNESNGQSRPAQLEQRTAHKLATGQALEAARLEIDAVLEAMRTRSSLTSVQDRGCATLASLTLGDYSNQVLAVSA